jgi:hypothetical protein
VPNGDQLTANTPGENGTIPSNFAAQETSTAQAISQQFPEDVEIGKQEFGRNFGEDEEAEWNEFDGNKDRSTRRGPYHLTAEEVAAKYACTLEHIKYSVEQGQLRLSNRTNQEIDPLPEWKVLTSSLEGWIPPQLPKKRGRPRKQQEQELAQIS